MSIRGHNWLNSQATRRYPLDDNATGTGDDGTRLKDDIISDLHLRWPSTAGQYAYIGGITVTEHVLSVVIMASDGLTAASSFTPLAAVTLRQPVDINRVYSLTPLSDGVGGFITFGDTESPFVIRCSTPAQGLLAPKTARAYAPLPIPTMRKYQRTDGLAGLVRILGENDVEVVKDTVTIDGQEKTALVIRLRAATGGENPLARYIGPCGQRPESLNCPRGGIETINGVGPDCDGNLRILFNGVTPGPYQSCGSEASGITIDQSLGLSDVCVDDNDPDRFGGEDSCALESSQSSLSASSLSSSLSSSLALPSSSSSLSSVALPCEELPFLECFSGSLHASWQKKAGAYHLVAQTDPNTPECVGPGICLDPASDSSHSSSLSMSSYSCYGDSQHVLRLSDGSQRNILVWEDCGVDTSVAKQITTALQLQHTGSRQNGGLVLNYHLVNPLSAPHIEYFVAQINKTDNRIELLRFNGSILVTENAVTPAIPFSLADWYQITVETADAGGGNVSVDVTVENLTTPAWPSVNFTVLTSQWLPADGQFGVYTNRAVTDFASWRIQDA